MTKSELRIDVLGTSFSLTVDEDLVTAQSVYGHYKTFIENVRKNYAVEDPLKIAIIAGLLLQDGVLKLRTSQRTSKGAIDTIQAEIEAEKNISDLIKKMDNVLSTASPENDNA